MDNIRYLRFGNAVYIGCDRSQRVKFYPVMSGWQRGCPTHNSVGGLNVRAPRMITTRNQDLVSWDANIVLLNPMRRE